MIPRKDIKSLIKTQKEAIALTLEIAETYKQRGQMDLYEKEVLFAARKQDEVNWWKERLEWQNA